MGVDSLKPTSSPEGGWELKQCGVRLTRRTLLRGAVAAAAFAAARPVAAWRTFRGRKPGEQREIEAIPLCWCPPGRFIMGSPPNETGHRPDEAQVEVSLSRGFWMARFEATQGQCGRAAQKVDHSPLGK